MPPDFLQQVAPDIARVVTPMRRFASVNAWIVGGSGSRAVVDTGMPGEAVADMWDHCELDRVDALVCTHMHRDHSGQATRLAGRFGVPLHMTQREWDRMALEAHASRAESTALLHVFLRGLGMAENERKALEPLDYSALAPLPGRHAVLADGQDVVLGSIDWRVLTGGGHSDEGACLVSRDGRYFIAGDQLLPGAGAHVSLGFRQPEADPLAKYFAFLDRLTNLPADMLVLPGHGAPYRDPAGQAARLRAAHGERLERVMVVIDGVQSCIDLMPLVFSERSRLRFGDLIPAMTGALLNHLWHGGRLRRHENEGGVTLFEKVS